MRFDRIAIACLAAAVLGVTMPARADVLADMFGVTDAHGFVSIDSVIDAARDSVPGMVVEAELEKKHGRWVYEIEIITPQHQEVELIFDAHSGALISMGKKRTHS